MGCRRGLKGLRGGIVIGLQPVVSEPDNRHKHRNDENKDCERSAVKARSGSVLERFFEFSGPATHLRPSISYSLGLSKRYHFDNLLAWSMKQGRDSMFSARRSNLLILPILTVLPLCAALAQGQPAAAPFVVHSIKPDVYWIEGGGGNSGVIVGANEVVVVDAKTTPAGGKELLDAIAKITPKPVTTVILTHSDGDHVNGLAAFPAGVKVIAHENNKKEQEAALEKGGRGVPPADHQPTDVVIGNERALTIGGVNIKLFHWGQAHTSGDLVVFLPSQKVVFTGDIIAVNRPDPLIHLEKNGSSEGWIETGKGTAALDADVFVPGHGAVQTKAEIEERVKRTEVKRAKIKDLVSQGKSLEEIKTALGEPPSAAAGGGGPNFASFTEVVYRELTKK